MTHKPCPDCGESMIQQHSARCRDCYGRSREVPLPGEAEFAAAVAAMQERMPEAKPGPRARRTKSTWRY